MKWINASIAFDDRVLLLYVSRHNCVKNIVDKLSEFEKDPSALELFLIALIELARPELKGCVLQYMGYQPEVMGFEILVSHPSLERRAPCAHAKREPLFKEEGQYA